MPVRIVGAGTWLDAGRPVSDAEPLHLSRLRGITEYEPGDLTLTAFAGTPLAEISDTTRANGQFLALDPFGAGNGTLGATLATASYGALGHAFGGPRDAALGVGFALADGTLGRAGGRVVKNVAGFDLVRLLVGSWGTLGVITDASVRLRALPDVDVTVALLLPPAPEMLDGLLAALRAAPVVPWAAELLCANLARNVGLQPRAVLLLRLAGNSEHVAAQEAAVRKLGVATAVSHEVWHRLRGFEDGMPLGEDSALLVARFSGRPSRLAGTWSHALTVAAMGDGRAHGTLGRGVARVALRAPVPTIQAALRIPNDCGMIIERMPGVLWPGMDPPPNVALARALRTRLDPLGIMNPGLLDPR